MTTNSTNPVDGDVQTLIMSQKEMQDFANIYRSDNDRGTYAWFDASLANWSEGFLSPKVFEHIFDQESATKWLDKEIENFIDDGRCPADYVYLKSNPALNPVILVFYEGKAVIWDGYHRIAAAVHRNMPVYAIFTTPPAQLLRPVELPDIEENETAFKAGLNSLVDCLEDCGDAEQGLRLALRSISEKWQGVKS